jgi:hypothetical protein
MYLHPMPTLFALLSVCTVVTPYTLRPLHVDLSRGVSRMTDLVRNTRVPPASPSPPSSPSSTLGIDTQWLQTLQKDWVRDFDWEREQNYMNK